MKQKIIGSKQLGNFLCVEDFVNAVHRLSYLMFNKNTIASILGVPVYGVEKALNDYVPTNAKRPTLHYDRYVIVTGKAFKTGTMADDILFPIHGEYIHGETVANSDFNGVIGKVKNFGGNYGAIMVYRLVPVIGGNDNEFT